MSVISNPLSFSTLDARYLKLDQTTPQTGINGPGILYVNSSNQTSTENQYGSAFLYDPYTGINLIKYFSSLYYSGYTGFTVDLSVASGAYNALYGINSSVSGGVSNRAIVATAFGSGTNWGVYASASGGLSAYGIYASASGATTNWAGYFDGDIKTTGKAIVSDQVDYVNGSLPDSPFYVESMYQGYMSQLAAITGWGLGLGYDAGRFVVQGNADYMTGYAAGGSFEFWNKNAPTSPGIAVIQCYPLDGSWEGKINFAMRQPYSTAFSNVLYMDSSHVYAGVEFDALGGINVGSGNVIIDASGNIYQNTMALVQLANGDFVVDGSGNTTISETVFSAAIPSKLRVGDGFSYTDYGTYNYTGSSDAIPSIYPHWNQSLGGGSYYDNPIILMIGGLYLQSSTARTLPSGPTSHVAANITLIDSAASLATIFTLNDYHNHPALLVPDGSVSLSTGMSSSGGGLSINTTGNAGFPINQLDVGGGSAIGSSYASVNTAPADGLIVQGKVGIGRNTATYQLDVTGDIRGTGYRSSDASAGITTTITTATLVGKTITVKNGLITGFA